MSNEIDALFGSSQEEEAMPPRRSKMATIFPYLVPFIALISAVLVLLLAPRYFAGWYAENVLPYVDAFLERMLAS